MQLYTNIFSNGWNTDVSRSYQQNNTYRDLVRATITSDDDGFLSLVNVRSSKSIGYITDGSIATTAPVLLSSLFCQWKDSSDAIRDGILLFYAQKENTKSLFEGSGSSVFKISFYDILNTTEYIVYRETGEYADKYTSSHLSSQNIFFQTKLYNELGQNIVYFSDGLRPPRVIHCNSLSYNSSDLFSEDEYIIEEELELLRLAPRKVFPEVSISLSKGSLTTGSYQFAYQFYNSKRNSYSKYSQLSNPICISSGNAFGFGSGTGSIGGLTSRSIDVTINLSEDNFEACYDTFRIVVVKNIDGTLIPSTTAYIAFEGKIEEYSLGGELRYNYTGNENEFAIPIEDITVDDLPIKSFNSFDIHRNVFIGGGVNLKELTFTQEPQIEDANYIENQVDAVDYFTDYDKVKYKVGYFRDEVYRYAISYYDSYGHYSNPRVIDFSSTTGNSSNSVDFKFPDRNISKVIGEDDIYSGTFPRNLGLRIEGIKNHPSWAKGFVILRQKRRKNIVSQTPLVPTQIIEPAAANTLTINSPYPGDGNTLGDQNGTLVAKNLRNPVTRHILRTEGLSNFSVEAEECSYFTDFKSKVERQDGREKHSMNVSVIYPHNYIYQNSVSNYGGYKHSNGDIITTVDIAFMTPLKIIDNEYISNDLNSNEAGNPANYGDYVEFESTCFLGAITTGHYYYTSGNASGKILREYISDTSQFNDIFKYSSDVVEYREMPNIGDSITLTSQKDTPFTYGNHEGIRSSNNEGYKPINLKSCVIVTSTNAGDISHKCTDVNSSDTGADNGVVKRQNIYSSSSIGRISAQATEVLSNDMISGGSSTVFTALRIVNIERGLSDNRYGNKNSYGEFIHTGTYYELSDSEILNNTPIDVEVWGGDCHISKHTFKVNSSSYAISGIKETSTISVDTNFIRSEVSESVVNQKWGSPFYGKEAGSNRIPWRRPIPLRSNASFITVWLESEVDGNYKTPDIVGRQESPFSDVSGSVADIPMVYEYNFSYSIENLNKVFIKNKQINENRYRFPSQIAYSLGKVYQTSIIGFDTFPVNNIYDMDESYGDINRIIVTGGDRVYVFQDESVSYLPIQSNIIQTDDLAQLSVRSSEFIGEYKYIATEIGTRYPESVATNGIDVFFFSGDRKAFYKLSGTSIQNIGIDSQVQSKIRELCEELRENSRVITLYDETRNHILFSVEFNGFNKDVLRYDEKMGKIISRTGLYTGSLQGGISYNALYYLIGNSSINSRNISVWINEEGDDYGTFLDSTSDAVAKIIVAPQKGTCTYDVVTLNADGFLKSITSSTENQGNSSTNLVDTFIESNYRIRKLRDSSKKRLRGELLEIDLRWNHTNQLANDYKKRVRVHRVLTRYRISHTPI